MWKNERFFAILNHANSTSHESYSKLTTEQLSTLSYAPDSPWARTAAGRDIPNTWIANEFIRQADAKRARTSASTTA